jgi:alkyldihydroxyacetonephosphate synthase
MDIQNLRWWGWGTLDREYSLEDLGDFWPSLQKWLGLSDETIEHATPPVSLEDISLRPSRLDDPVLASLRALLGEQAVHTDGKSYRDLVRIRAGHIPNPPDAVAYPVDQRQICSLLAWAAERDITIIPFGGGSSVVGGVESPEEDERPALTLDLANLDRVLCVDPVSRVARIQAGTTGPEVESQLNAQSFTLGHFPQSFEFSTLGGWIAARSTGQNSVGYGKIEDMTQAVRVVTPSGVVETRDVPATAAGPGLLHLLVGSEGAYGVITEATMRIHPMPEVQDCRGMLFRNLEDGIAACRDLVQSVDLHPVIVRLSDAPETMSYTVLNHEHRGLRGLADTLLQRYLKIQGYDWTSGNTLMLLGFAGKAKQVARQWDRASEICGDHQGFSLGRAVGQSWMHDRYIAPYLRDTLLDRGVMADILETATTWSNLMHLYESMATALRGAIPVAGGGPGYVMMHISHACEQGASLCATFLGRQVNDPDPLAKQAQWQAIKQTTTDAILAAGGTLTHHHGVGRDHAPWLEEEVGLVSVQGLEAFKHTFDPAGIMNPGVLLTS